MGLCASNDTPHPSTYLKDDPPSARAKGSSSKDDGKVAKESSVRRGSKESTVNQSKDVFIKHHTDRNIGDFYVITHAKSKCLGSGMTGTVKPCTHKVTGVRYACKTIWKERVTDVDGMRREIDLLKELDHPNILRLHESYEDEFKIYIIMELCTGGELFDRLEARGEYTERECAALVVKMIKAIGYCHSRGICHRDLKLENFLFESEAADAELKLIDFGLSKVYFNENVAGGRVRKMKTVVGTSYYIAPEVLNGSYTNACDMWSLGVITYVLLCGYPPFNGHTNEQIFAAIRKGTFRFKQKIWETRTSQCRDFIQALVTVAPHKRLTAEQALEHPWLRHKGGLDKQALIGESTGKEVIQSLRAFATSSKLKRSILTYLALTLEQEKIAELRDIFVAIDKDNSGKISYDELKKALLKCGLVSDDGSFVQVGGADEKEGDGGDGGGEEKREESGMFSLSSLKDIFKSLDEDEAGSIQYTEFLAATVQMQLQLNEESLHGVFNRLDVSNTGVITTDDLKVALGDVFSVDHIQLIMEKADVDNNNVISFKEFVALVRDDHKEHEGKLFEGLEAVMEEGEEDGGGK